jgi:hypothetical protein
MSGQKWTPKEDEIVRTYSIKDAFYLLKENRTKKSIEGRRQRLDGAMVPAYSSVHRRWNASEDDILRSSSSVKVAVRQLSGRTPGAVVARRGILGVGTSLNYWTKAEDRRIIRTAALSVQKAMRRFKNRTAVSIRLRRQRLGCLCRHIRGPNCGWKSTEVKLLQEKWPTCKLSEVQSALPRHPRRSVSWKARELGLKKVKTFDPTDLLDQIKSRLYEDGISSRRLAAEIGCGIGFLKCRPNAKHDFNKIAKAVDFFGGRLVIDWQDE